MILGKQNGISMYEPSLPKAYVVVVVDDERLSVQRPILPLFILVML